MGHAPGELERRHLNRGELCPEKREGGCLGVRFPGAWVRRHFHLDDSLAQVGLGQPAAKVHFLPEKCACLGLTGLPETDRQSRLHRAL